jgi:hypothetical protein
MWISPLGPGSGIRRTTTPAVICLAPAAVIPHLLHVSSVLPWISVSPESTPAAILGDLPFLAGSVTLPIPPSVVPETATGILVFAWTILSGYNPSSGHWHIASTSAGGDTNWFSMLIAGQPVSGVVCNSQAFWLPMPADGSLVVTLNNDLPSPDNTGEVEIHGYYP